ncbi:PfkB family carbohydrate kinase [Thiomicrospira sp. WB1]|uniref:PfkB family carbohydrate kinase n=1 Tax=Thiomicrospira sp. WB1 TaxID=1685380 RepID=UPI0007481336|nr:PfkB family carbohydrate kinase [Thiomicrospira sp. WB1]KUJ71713.1 carbohydrate kinase [Thiomicrospira sp. WB1]
MANILGIGNCVLDTILDTDHYPREDEEMRAQGRTFSVGGNVANSLYVLNQLGHASTLVTATGGDHEAKQLKQGLEARSINTDHIQRFLQGATPTSYVIRNRETGSRTITHFRDLPEVSFDFFAKIEIENWDWLHFEGRNLSHLPGMLNIARTFLDQQPISLEVEKPREGIETVFELANVIIFSHHYARAKGYQDGEALLSALAPSLTAQHLICTWGTKGAWFKSAGQQTVHHQPAKEIDQVIDTLGAGDTFNAGLIDALLQGHALAESVKAASDLASHKCQKQGLDNLLAPIEKPKPLANQRSISQAKVTVVPAPKLGHSVLLISDGSQVKAYENNCPHQNVPLNEAYKVDVNPFEKTMKCSVHDAFFKIENGECVEGPCLNDALQPVAIRVEDNGDIYLAD